MKLTKATKPPETWLREGKNLENYSGEKS